MESKIKTNHRSNDLSKMDTVPDTKVKNKARKELWDSLLAVYENEKKALPTKKMEKIKSKEISHTEGQMPNISKNILKQEKKRKSRNHKISSNNENIDHGFNIVVEKEKERKKVKGFKDYKGSFKSSADIFENNKTNNIPPIIVLHQYRKNFDNLNENDDIPKHQYCYTQDKIHNKSKHLHSSENQEKKFILGSVASQNVKEAKENKSNIILKHSKDKFKKRLHKGVIYKTLSSSLEAKLRKKKRKSEKQQILKEVATTLGRNEEIYDQIKHLPLKINEDDLIFMHPSHVTKALGHRLDKTKNNPNHAKDKFSFKILSSNNNADENGYITSSAVKLAMNRHSSMKQLRKSSVKKIKKPKASCFEEISDKSLNKDHRNIKGDKKKRKKYSSTEIYKGIQNSHSLKKTSRGSHKVKLYKQLMKNENNSSKLPSVLEQNICCGDNGIDSFTNTISSQDKIHKSNHVNFKMETPKRKLVSILKEHPREQKTQPNFLVEKHVEERKDRNGRSHNFNVFENGNKSFTSEDEKKLTFQLVKANMNSRRYKRLRKNVYSISDRRTLKTSRESSHPSLQNNRLYVTKKMLFYANKESSGTSKESLNIAISRDTEISKNGSSNNVLNVVIKQTKNSGTSSKIISPKFDLNKQSIENSDKTTKKGIAKNDEKLEIENIDMENILCNTDKNAEVTNKHLKEAECQTEDNTPMVFNEENGEGLALKQHCECDENLMQEDLKNVYIYHFNNLNSKYTKDIEIGNNIKSKFFSKPILPLKSNINTVSFLDFNTLSNNAANSMKTISFDKQYKIINSSKDKEDICDGSEKIKSKFYTVVDINDCNLSKNVFETPKENTTIKYKFNHKETQQKTTNKNENKKLESVTATMPSDELICSKLKSVGLTDKRSFVRIINSKPSIIKPLYNKLQCNNNISGDIVYCPLKSSEKEIHSIPANDGNSHNTAHFNYSLPVNNKNDSKHKKNSKTKLHMFENGNLNKSDFNKDKQNHIKKDMLDTSINTQNLTTFLEPKKDNFNGLQVCLKGSNTEVKKEHFINVLPENGENAINNESNLKKINTFEIKRKVSSSLRNFAVSEMGVQTDVSDLVQTIPYKSVSSLRKKNSNVLLSNTLCFKSVPAGLKCEDDFKIDDKLKKTNLRTVPIKKNSFVHIVKNSERTFVNDFTGNVTQKNQPDFSQNISDENEKQINVLKNCQDEQQILYKINAIYDFLQYLDKMLKENSILKQDSNSKSCTLGQFNSTLRCLCNNCLEILKKIELEQDKIKTISNQKNCYEPNCMTHAPDKKSVFEQTVNKLRNEKNKTRALGGQFINFKGGENNKRDFKSHIAEDQMSPRPFFVVLSKDDKSNYNFRDHWSNLKSGQYQNLNKELNYGLFPNKFQNNLQGKCNEILLKQEINKWRIEQREGDGDKRIINQCESLKHRLDYGKQQLGKEITSKLFDSFVTIEEKLAWQKKIEMRKDDCPSIDYTNNKLQFQENNIYVKHHNITDNIINKRTHQNMQVNLSSDLKSENLNSDLHEEQNSKSKCSVFSQSRSYIDSSKTGTDCISIQESSSYKNRNCDCCLSNRLSDSIIFNHEAESDEISKTQNHKSQQDNDIEICCCCLKDISTCYCHKNKKSETHDQKSKCASLFSHLTSKIPFKKESRFGKKNINNGAKTFNEFTINTNSNSQCKKCLETKGTITERKLETSPNLRTQQFSDSVDKSKPFHTKKKIDSGIYSDIISPDSNDNEKINNGKMQNTKNFKQRKIHSLKEFCSESSLHSIQQKSWIFFNRNLSPAKNIFQESLDDDSQLGVENQVSPEFESDGWVSLNDNLTEIENNQVCLDMNISHIPLTRVEYLQKFPDNCRE